MSIVIEVAEALYREANPGSKFEPPSFVYEKIENLNVKRIASRSTLSLYDWCKQELEKNKRK